MKYYTRSISSKNDYRKGRWTCDAFSIGIDTSNDDSHCVACLNYIKLLLNKTDLLPYVILYKVAPYGFNRVDKFKGMNFHKSILSLGNCLDFLTSDNGCEYMLACAEMDPTIISPDIFETHQTVFFLGNERNYNKLTASITELKNIENIENFLINSGMIIVEDYDTIDIGSTLWFVSNNEAIESLAKVLNLI